MLINEVKASQPKPENRTQLAHKRHSSQERVMEKSNSNYLNLLYLFEEDVGNAFAKQFFFMYKKCLITGSSTLWGNIVKVCLSTHSFGS
ncbi:unnamed protein product [Ixodes persulcatus]